MKTALLCLLLAPLLGFFVNALRWRNEKLFPASLIGVFSCFLSFAISLFLFFALLNQDIHSMNIHFFQWVHLASFQMSFSFLLDPLSTLMLLVITGVGFLIHLFSVYYMSHDKRPAKYFSFLNLFVFSMMVLVLADNLFLLFFGWEAVGFCSYLLIGFWFTDKQKAGAGMKAFVFNRIGDMGFLLAMLLLFTAFQTLNFSEISLAVSSSNPENLDVIFWSCLFLVLGAIGKSAQIPLFAWLPSAMAGPTPVSALIHAATMVTAGIYLIVRLDFLFVLAPQILSLVAFIGTATAFFSALVACAQSDIKKILAYSTLSQLGYMFLATGLQAFTASMFHLVTHAFFKALLFLSAGAIIHSLHGEQNIYRMGGLRKKLPWTYACFLVGFFSLIGFFPFSGFFSKDEILWSTFASGSYFLFAIAFITALLTTFYMTRLLFLTFYGETRFVSNKALEAESFLAKLPLVILAILSALGGLLGIPHLIGESFLPEGWHIPHFIEAYLKPVVLVFPIKGTPTSELILIGGSFLSVFFVFALTIWFYSQRASTLQALKNKFQVPFHWLEQAFKVDSFYNFSIIKPTLKVSRELYEGVDQKILQGFIFLIQKCACSAGVIFNKWQNGKLNDYSLYIILGLIFFLLFVFMG